MFAVRLVLLAVSSLALVMANSESDLQATVNKLLDHLDANGTESVLYLPSLSVDLWSLLRIAVHQEVKSQTEAISKLRAAKSFPAASTYPATHLDLVDLGGKKYFFSKKQKLSWIDSVMFCRLYGMELASIETREEDVLIVAHLKEIGIEPHITWISGNKIGRSTYMWMNGESIIYENWHPDHPPHFATEHCMLYQQGKWTDYHCSGHDWYFICEQ